MCNRNCYGFLNFLFDVFMTIITGGLWIVWVIARSISRSNCNCRRCNCGC